MHNLEIGPLSLTFMRTVRVKEVDTSNLPPGMGCMDIYKVSDYGENCPNSWDRDAYFIAMHDIEAMWMNFQCCTPVAILISAGNINAISGEEFENKLAKDNYLIAPPQPWLDGWKSNDGSVYQFVSTTAGEGLSVGEQISKTKDHAMQISVFEPKDPEKLRNTLNTPRTTWGMSDDDECIASDYDFCKCGSLKMCASEMAVGKGGKIIQKIYEDPHGIEEWKENPTKTVKVYLINAAQFAEITNKEMPPTPVSNQEYQGMWYGLDDNHLNGTTGSAIFNNLKSVGT